MMGRNRSGSKDREEGTVRLYSHIDTPAVKYYDIYNAFQNMDLAFWQEEVRQAQGRVLELACGTGRVLLPLARAGFAVTGLDLSEPMLEVARRKLAEEADGVRDRVRLVHGDMRDYSLDERFDLIFCAFNSFLLLGDDASQQAMLRRSHQHLSEGGRLILSIFNPGIAIIASYLGENSGKIRYLKSFTDPETGETIAMWDRRSYDPAEQIVDVAFIFERLDEQGRTVERHTNQFRMRYRFRYEMEYLLNLCGYEVEALYGDYGRGPVHADSLLIFVAKAA
jgi:SAM-dependent methyltransferase